MEILGKFLILDNEWQRKSQPQSQPSPSVPQEFRKRLCIINEKGVCDDEV